MRVMWSVFVTFPEVADLIHQKPEYACTWARALSMELRTVPGVELAIVSVADESDVKKFEVNGVTFYFLPNGKAMKRNGGGTEAQEFWKSVINDFQPDIIHVHGSESPVSIELTRLDINVPIYLTLQGIISNYYKDEYAGINVKDIVATTTIRDIVRRSGIIMDRKRTEKKSSLEKEIIRNVHYIGGRTTWDKVSSLAINPDAEYIYAPEMIRNEFYDSQRWDINQMTRHRIFMHQGFKPIKGLHILIEALAALRKKYPDVELYMSGSNYMKNETFKDRLLQPGYIKYLFKKMKEYNVEDCIHFTGVLDGEEIVRELKKAHVMVLPSAIENSPNSLCEAQLVGIPCVASYVGGVPEMIDQGKTGFLYTFNEPLLLAEYISQIFESDDLAEQMSSNEYNSIRERQGKEMVLKQTVDNYKFVINDYKKNR